MPAVAGPLIVPFAPLDAETSVDDPNFKGIHYEVSNPLYYTLDPYPYFYAPGDVAEKS
jgi:hypothetical protein